MAKGEIKKMLNIKDNMIMKYRVFALMGVLALSAGSMWAQDYDDIYYDASKSVSGTTKETKVDKKSKTVVVYGDVSDKYKVAAKSNYRVERDEDEYNRRGAFEPTYEVDINGDTIYLDSTYVDDESFANTRRIERFYNPDIVILSDDDDLVELYYDESPTVNLVVGTDMGYMASYGWASSYYPWYSGWYNPWSIGYYSPWYAGWHDPWAYSYYGWYSPWYSHWHGPSLWGWNYWGPRPWRVGWGGHNSWYDWGSVGHNHWNYGHGTTGRRYQDNYGWRGSNGRVGFSNNRNGNKRIGHDGISRSSNPSRGSGVTGGGSGTTRTRGGYASNRNNTVTPRGGAGTTARTGNVSKPSTGSTTRGGYYNGGSRSYSGSSSSGSRSYSGSSSSGSRSYSGSSSSSSRSSGSYSGGGSSRGSSGGGSHGGSSGGGGSRRH